jgi:outer membrane protein insertion porin family
MGGDRRRPAAAGRLHALVLLAMVASFGVPASARAQGADLPEELRTIAAVRIRGAKHLSRHELAAAGLRTRQPSLLPWRERPLVRHDYLVADSAAIVALYSHYGYLDARVEVRLLEQKRSHSTIVEFRVHEGAISRVGPVELEGVNVVPRSEVQHALLAQTGHPYDPVFPQLDGIKIQTLYQEHGYFARVDTSARRGVPDSLHVGLRYAVTEGPQYRVGEITYLHGERVREYLGRRELLVKPGDVFKRSRLDRSIERLYTTGLFRQVQVSTLPDSTTGRLDVLLRVTDRAPRWVDVGIGSGTTNRYQVSTELGHRNIDTRALGGVVDGKLARDGQNKPLLAASSVTLSEPWVFGVRLLTQAAALYNDTYDRNDPHFTRHLVQQGVNLSFYHELSSIARVTLVQENTFSRESYSVNNTTPSDTTGQAHEQALIDSVIATVVPRYRTNKLRLILERDVRDVKILPRRGSYQTLTGELAGGPLKGASSYRKALFTSSWYSPLRNGRQLATRATVGVMQPFGSSLNFSPELETDPQVRRVPQESRFYIGGVNSLRGYSENEVPTSGGLAMALVNVEWRAPLAGPFGMEAFIDAGNVWARPEYIKASNFIAPWNAHRAGPGDVRYTYGVGGRLLLPFGPLRIDLAWSRNPDFPYGRKFLFHRTVPFVYQFAIGPSF